MQLRLAVSMMLFVLVAACGAQKSQDRHDPVGVGGQGADNSGDQTAANAVCTEDVAVVTGIVGTKNVAFRATIRKADFQAPEDTSPGWLSLDLGGDDKIWLQFMNAPVQGGTVATRGFIIKESADLAVGHCSDSVFSAQLALSKDSATTGSFYLFGFYGHDGQNCDSQPLAGTLSGCFRY